MKEKQNTNADAQGLPLVAIKSSKTQRKETRRSVPHLTLFQDHLVLESKPRFSIILRLENAVGQTLGQTASFRQTAPENWCQSRVCDARSARLPQNSGAN